MQTPKALILRADALKLPLPDESVDLIVSSPPYFALRSYRDGDEHYSGQIGSEPTPQAFLEALWAVMHECWRVLKPTGSCFINLGDKRAGSGGHNNSNVAGTSRNAAKRWCVTCERHVSRTACPSCGSTNLRIPADILPATRRNAPDRYNQAAFGRTKSKMLLPHRFAIGCEDGLADPEGKGWIMRSDIVWQKLNGLPESVTDRCRDSHEYLFHFVKEGRYFAAVDEIRTEAQAGRPQAARAQQLADAAGLTDAHRVALQSRGLGDTGRQAAVQNGTGKNTPEVLRPAAEADDVLGGYAREFTMTSQSLGKLPGSVWPLASEPLIISDEVKAHYDLPDHFAAFPSELARRVILGWSPSGVCVECGEGRRPVVAKERTHTQKTYAGARSAAGVGQVTNPGGDDWLPGKDVATITGYSCRCTAKGCSCYGEHSPTNHSCVPPTRPSVVLDVFGGTGTTAGVARALGRTGVSVDLSHDYSRLADWRVHRSGHFAKVVNRTNQENQGDLFGVPA